VDQGLPDALCVSSDFHATSTGYPVKISGMAQVLLFLKQRQGSFFWLNGKNHGVKAFTFK
jgi:hypothetical protein